MSVQPIDSGKPDYELTHNPLTGTSGFICRVHGIHRSGLTQQHAVNVERQHIRDHHTPPMATIANNLVVDLTAAAVRVGAAYQIEEAGAAIRGNVPHAASCDVSRGGRCDCGTIPPKSPVIDLWEAMTGLDPETARELAYHLVGHTDHHTAAVVPL